MFNTIDIDSLSHIISFLSDKSATNVMQCCVCEQFRNRLKTRYSLKSYYAVENKPWGTLRKETQFDVLKPTAEGVHFLQFFDCKTTNRTSLHLDNRHNTIHVFSLSEICITGKDFVESININCQQITLGSVFPNLTELIGCKILNLYPSAHNLKYLQIRDVVEPLPPLLNLENLKLCGSCTVDIIAPNLKHLNLEYCKLSGAVLRQESAQNLETLSVYYCSATITHLKYPKLHTFTLNRTFECNLAELDAPNLTHLTISGYGQDRVSIVGLKSKLQYLSYHGTHSIDGCDFSELHVLKLFDYRFTTKWIQAPKLTYFYATYCSADDDVCEFSIGIFNVPSKYWQRWPYVSQHLASKKYGSKFKMLREKVLTRFW